MHAQWSTQQIKAAFLMFLVRLCWYVHSSPGLAVTQQTFLLYLTMQCYVVLSLHPGHLGEIEICRNYN